MAAASDWQLYLPWGAPSSTLASAATLTPGPGLTILTGNVGIANITPPVPGPHMIGLLFAGTAGVLATGNVSVATASIAGQVMLLVWNTTSGKYNPVG